MLASHWLSPLQTEGTQYIYNFRINLLVLHMLRSITNAQERSCPLANVVVVEEYICTAVYS